MCGAFSLLRRVDDFTGLVSLLMKPAACLRLRRIRDWRSSFAFAFSDDPLAMLIRPMQVKSEVLRLLSLLAGLRPKVVLEIGTARGGTLFLWTRVAAEDALLISIDLPGGPFGGGYPILKGLLYRCFRVNNQRVVLLRGDSHSKSMLMRVRRILGGRGVDFLFIDGDHRYEGVKRDFELYAPLVNRHGVIAFHDIVPGPPENVGGVPRFWRELKSRLPPGSFLEIVEDWGQGGYGIGVVFLEKLRAPIRVFVK